MVDRLSRLVDRACSRRLVVENGGRRRGVFDVDHRRRDRDVHVAHVVGRGVAGVERVGEVLQLVGEVVRRVAQRVGVCSLVHAVTSTAWRTVASSYRPSSTSRASKLVVGASLWSASVVSFALMVREHGRRVSYHPAASPSEAPLPVLDRHVTPSPLSFTELWSLLTESKVKADQAVVRI